MKKRGSERFFRTTGFHLKVLMIVLSPIALNEGLGVSKKPHGGGGHDPKKQTETNRFKTFVTTTQN